MYYQNEYFMQKVSSNLAKGFLCLRQPFQNTLASSIIWKILYIFMIPNVHCFIRVINKFTWNNCCGVVPGVEGDEASARELLDQSEDAIVVAPLVMATLGIVSVRSTNHVSSLCLVQGGEYFDVVLAVNLK